MFGLFAGCESSTRDETFAGDSSVFPGTPGPTGFPSEDNRESPAPGLGICNPRQAGACWRIAAEGGEDTGLTCCSDDPSTADGAVPGFAGIVDGGSPPLFAGANNTLGVSGMCVDVREVERGLQEDAASGCPVPCNPTWGEDERRAVCGEGRSCCQTRPLEQADCITIDGDTRPVTGADIPDATRWANDEHATHQDPGGVGCQALAGAGVGEAYEDCVHALTVADQRGFCVPADVCPEFEQPC